MKFITTSKRDFKKEPISTIITLHQKGWILGFLQFMQPNKNDFDYIKTCLEKISINTEGLNFKEVAALKKFFTKPDSIAKITKAFGFFIRIMEEGPLNITKNDIIQNLQEIVRISEKTIADIILEYQKMEVIVHKDHEKIALFAQNLFEPALLILFLTKPELCEDILENHIELKNLPKNLEAIYYQHKMFYSENTEGNFDIQYDVINSLGRGIVTNTHLINHKNLDSLMELRDRYLKKSYENTKLFQDDKFLINRTLSMVIDYYCSGYYKSKIDKAELLLNIIFNLSFFVNSASLEVKNFVYKVFEFITSKGAVNMLEAYLNEESLSKFTLTPMKENNIQAKLSHKIKETLLGLIKIEKISKQFSMILEDTTQNTFCKQIQIELLYTIASVLDLSGGNYLTMAAWLKAKYCPKDFIIEAAQGDVPVILLLKLILKLKQRDINSKDSFDLVNKASKVADEAGTNVSKNFTEALSSICYNIANYLSKLENIDPVEIKKYFDLAIKYSNKDNFLQEKINKRLEANLPNKKEEFINQGPEEETKEKYIEPKNLSGAQNSKKTQTLPNKPKTKKHYEDKLDRENWKAFDNFYKPKKEIGIEYIEVTQGKAIVKYILNDNLFYNPKYDIYVAIDCDVQTTLRAYNKSNPEECATRKVTHIKKLYKMENPGDPRFYNSSKPTEIKIGKKTIKLVIIDKEKPKHEEFNVDQLLKNLQEFKSTTTVKLSPEINLEEDKEMDLSFLNTDPSIFDFAKKLMDANSSLSPEFQSPPLPDYCSKDYYSKLSGENQN